VYTDRWVGVWATNTYGQTLAFYLGLYFAFGVLYGGFTFCRSLRFLFFCVAAAVNMHNALLHHLLRLPKVGSISKPA
jgi:ATP-binding cassette, subfamily C (CFTR/MRP), member 1